MNRKIVDSLKLIWEIIALIVLVIAVLSLYTLELMIVPFYYFLYRMRLSIQDAKWDCVAWIMQIGFDGK